MLDVAGAVVIVVESENVDGISIHVVKVIPFTIRDREVA